MQRWLPHPLLTLTLILLWLFLVNEIGPGHLLLGTALGILIPYLTAGFWPNRPRLRRPLLLGAYLARVLSDILLANVEVARLVLGPMQRLSPAFIEVPLDLRDEFAITLLANTVSLTPGSVSADISADRRTLLVHVLDAPDPDALVGEIKARYEAPLREILG